jgi:hypothetical protein
MFKVLSRPSQPIQKPNIASGLAAHGEKAQRLNATGQDGTATITAVRDTAVTVGDNPSIEMDLQVQVAGAGPPYPVTHEQVVSRHSVGNFQPGASVVVKVDPEDPESIFVA